MFPKWFDNWNKDNPTNIFGPAIAVGVVGSAVFVAGILVIAGQPFAVETQQTGPRGTGMHVAEFVSSLEAGDPAVANFITSDPIVPEEGAATVGGQDGVPPALANVTPENYERLVTAMRAWTGIPDLLEPGNDSYQTEVAYSMIEMTQNINQNWAAHVQANAEVGVTCYTLPPRTAGAEQRLVPGQPGQFERGRMVGEPEPRHDGVELQLAAVGLSGNLSAGGCRWPIRGDQRP